jgi:hypothetical protein
VGLKGLGAGLELLAKEGRLREELARHPHPLGALAGKDKGDFSRDAGAAGHHLGPRSLLRQGLQTLTQIFCLRGEHHRPLGKKRSLAQTKRHILEGKPRGFFQLGL